jgi:hypothetical protein
MSCKPLSSHPNPVSLYLSSTRDVAYSQLKANGLTRDKVEEAGRALAGRPDLWKKAKEAWKDYDGDKAAAAAWVFRAVGIPWPEPIVVVPKSIPPPKNPLFASVTGYSCAQCGGSFSCARTSRKRTFCPRCVEQRHGEFFMRGKDKTRRAMTSDVKG